MARTFVDGGSDRVAGTVTAVDTGGWSAGAWVFPTSASTLVRVYQIGNNVSAAQGHMMYLQSSQSFVVQANWSTGDQSRVSGSNAYTTNVWNCLIGTTDGAGTGSTAHVYAGKLATPMANVDSGTTSDGTGSRTTGLTVAEVGNRPPDHVRGFPGRIAQCFYVPWEMTLLECERFRQGDWTVLFAHGAPRFFQPLSGSMLFEVGGSTGLWTATGATVSEDPPVAAGWGESARSIIVAGTASNATPTAVAASFTIPTPVVKTGIWKVSDRGVRNSTSTGTAVVTLTDPTTIAVGNYLVARVAVDNSGTNGALPGLAVTDSRSHTWTLETGANQDPGTASAGASCYLAYVRVVTPFQAADTVTFTWTTGTPRSAIVLVEWTGIHDTTPRAVTSTRANNVSSTAQPTGAITPTAANQLVFITAAAEQLGTEWGAQDTDTTNGVWVDVPTDSANTGTHDTSMSVYGGYKLVTASGAQTWNNTLSATGDWATVSIVFGPDIHENIYTVIALPAAFVIPTPTIDIPTGTNVTPTAVAATFVVPTPSIANITNVTPTAVAATFVIPTPAVTVTTRPTPTVVAATFVVPTPTFTRTTTPTPTAVAAAFVIPTSVVSTSVSATLTAVAGTFVIPTPTVSTGVIVNATAAAATFVVPTPTRTATANVAVTAVAASFTIPTPSVTTGSNTFVSVTAVAATFVVPTPAIAGTQVTPAALAATFTVPTPAIAGTQVAATAAAATFVIPTPTVTTAGTVNVNVTAVTLVAVIPTPTFNRTTTPTPTAVAMLMAVPAPGRTASANILATVLQAVFAIGTHIPTGQVIGGNVTSTVVLVGDVTSSVARYGTTAGVALANNVTVVIDQ